MAGYEIEISRTAEKLLRRLSAAKQKHVVEAILMLADQPFPRGSRKLAGYDDVFRIRVGVFRILYSVSKKRVVIIILKIGRRKDGYRT